MVVEGAGSSVINSELGWRVLTGQSWAGLVAQCQEDREVVSPGLLVKGIEEESEWAGGQKQACGWNNSSNKIDNIEMGYNATSS